MCVSSFFVSYPRLQLSLLTNPNKLQVKGSSNFNNLGLDQESITQLIEHLNEVCYLFNPLTLFYAQWGKKRMLIMLLLKTLDLDIPLDKAKDFHTGECLTSSCFALLYGMEISDGAYWKSGIWRIISRKSMRKTMKDGRVIKMLGSL